MFCKVFQSAGLDTSKIDIARVGASLVVRGYVDTVDDKRISVDLVLDYGAAINGRKYYSGFDLYFQPNDMRELCQKYGVEEEHVKMCAEYVILPYVTKFVIHEDHTWLRKNSRGEYRAIK